MKKARGLLLVLVVIFLTACAARQGEVQRVRCPACGYEFDAPAAYK